MQFGGQFISEPTQTMQMQVPFQTMQTMQAPIQTVQRVQMPMVVSQYQQPMSVQMPAAVQYQQPMSVQMPAAAQYQQPMSVQMPAAAPIGMRALALPAAHPRSPADLLARGNLYSEVQVSEDHLRSTGNLITDQAAEASVQARLKQMQGSFLPISYAPPSVHYNAEPSQPHNEVAPQYEMPPAPLHQEPHPESCEWMFGDVATGWLGIHALAHLNPLRWSGPLSFEQAIQDLQDTEQHQVRPIQLKIPANSHQELACVDQQQAIEHLCSVAGIQLQYADEQPEQQRSLEAYPPAEPVYAQNYSTLPVQAPPQTGAAGRLARAGFGPVG